MNTFNSTTKLVRPTDGHCLELGAEARHLLLSDKDTNGALSLFRCRFNAGGDIPLQLHTREDQWFWIEHGIFDFQTDSQTVSLGQGDFVFVPRRNAYAFTCTQDAGTLIVGAMGVDSAYLFRALADADSETSHLDSTQMQQLATKHGVQFGDFEMAGVPCARPQIIRSHEGETIEAFGDSGRFLVSSKQTQNRFCLGMGQTPSLSGPPLHVHGREDELFFILSGRYEFQIGDVRLQAEAGDIVWAPCGVPHTFRVVSNEPGQCLTLCTPGGFDEFFHQCFELFQSGTATPLSLTEIGLAHQIRFLLPNA